MKIAICLSGQPRGIPLSIEKTREGIIDSNPNVDVFLHAWFNPDKVGERFLGAQPRQAHMIGREHPETSKLLEDGYMPKKAIIEPQRDFSWANSLRQSPTAVQEHLASMFYSMWMANELKKEYEISHGFKYDCVVRARFDLLYYQPICFEDYKNDLDFLITSKRFQDEREDPRFLHGNYTLTDIFVFSNSENMDKFCGVYPEFKDINTKIYPPFGENYQGYHCKVTHNMKVKTMPFDYEILQRVVNLDEVQ